jgi:hypothetical protein
MSREYYNQPVADWAGQNISGRVVVRPRLSSTAGKIFTYALLFCVPAAFFALGVVGLIIGVKDKQTIYGAFFFAFLLMIPAGVIALLGAYVRRGFVKSLKVKDNQLELVFEGAELHLRALARGSAGLRSGGLLPLLMEQA